MLDGILVVDKAAGMTSHDVVAIARGVVKQKRIGHTGTLDPAVTGVLPLCLGKATRLADYISAQGKAYVGTMEFGYRTDTLDASGEVSERAERTAVPLAEIEAVLQKFTGTIDQKPPMYAAVKKDGVRLYELARKGITVERPTRKVTIHKLEILDATDAQAAESGISQVKFVCECSKGTYIRSLVDDIGVALGTLATMTSLRRTRVAKFTLEQAIPVAQFKEMDASSVSAHLLPMDLALQHLPAVRLDQRRGDRVQNGLWQHIDDLMNDALANLTEKDPVRVYGARGFIGIGHIACKEERHRIVMDKVLANPKE